MRRAKHLIGVHVVTLAGETVGEVTDVLLDPTGKRVIGIAICAGTLVRKQRFVRRGDIMDITDGLVTIRSRKAAQSTPIGGHGLEDPRSPLGKLVEGPEGGNLGRVRDLLLDLNRLKVWGFELSDGLVSDVLNGIPQLPRRDLQKVGNRMVLHPYPAERHMKPKGDGKSTPRGGERW